ncbi:D-alanyl-D-alanine carboxypeptidase / D-alanyl-D-alanine-endopeptidase (penicillin-binding protein 4) [Streptoalloteichus tenebrarius]|uniref:D-alanyl-D-alanine carboxypeptidase / D-alanyl-D-alanine-endopeptidase (Penicillin-binding protein 4) n=1 Tax=Streptoalloteichus tenebrarius (strain ATCC 17920 / DSM 40477 / JCM 4838 / CBS 697.72 / NBRC 16177 / NCIMB 11028 / NRRL B-12390 / A12253. 1 / ISP 5477) TaxID=1933 RepID=A0ABT1I311_STRSD|nr:D-alanyl-D-alanine carboxypeptidase/D-alanyl-D-alanine-endopeptidase [Streptoalloteichus tenebrarius]MCP2262171.1 D-alanyl-D-alanine carboxypeptidase / D-alanyl-D-alanine-endopeptidase (penicillin-binding protein 4) [Streptoalloteichus tenebrarius]BFF00026.1 D-alanyl-D-alanine carboxypeptidase/D-alanyl-D-alanine-endopeptidase [Streptoalloteichus tenebrarius]
MPRRSTVPSRVERGPHGGRATPGGRGGARRLWLGAGSVLLAGLLVGSGVAAVNVVTATTAVAEPVGRAALVADLDRILTDPQLRGARSSVVVRDAASGEVLYDRGGSDRLAPASNAKMLTAAAALETLGPDHRFTTEVFAAGPRHGGFLDGDLYLRGTGDPTMLAADYDGLAARVAESGIRVVRRLVADDTWFDRVPLGAGWAWDDEPYYYSAEISALTVSSNSDYDAGTVLVRVKPGTPGQPPVVELDPPTGVVRVDNRATTGAAGSSPAVTAERQHGTNTVVVTGSVPAGGQPVSSLSTVSDPTAYAIDVFRRALAARGVRVLDANNGRGATPSGAARIAERTSMPLSELLVPFLKLSNNGHAETLVKAMGRAVHGVGSWDAGLRVVRDKLAGLGLDAAAYQVVDGSGLSRMDLVSAQQFAAFLVEARKRPWFPVFSASLPVAGEPDRMVGGTLRNRMRGTPAAGNVRAKTGSMTSVSSLSGYVTSAEGRPLVFSAVFNNFLGPATKNIEDALAVRLARHQGERDRRGEPGVTLAPPAAPQADNPGTRVDESALECTWAGAC